jgi:Tfp pilus assembly protein PilF
VLGSVALVALCFAIYAPSYFYDPARHEGFVWDDDDHFLNDPLVRAPDGWWRVFADPQPGIVGAEGGAVVWNYWPIPRASFWLDRHLWGVDTRGQPNLVAARITNVALHALIALLLGIVLLRLDVPGARLAALVFAVHPMAVESVAWITERKTLLGTAFGLATLLAWLRFEREGARRWYLAALGLFVATLLAKTSTVMLPVVLVLLRWYERKPLDARAVARLAPFFAASLVGGVTSIVFERHFIGSQGDFFETSIAERVATAGWIVWFYAGHVLAPFSVSFNYPRFAIDAASPTDWLPSAALVVVGAVLWRHRDTWARPWLLALGAFVANLFPVLGFFGVYGMRYAQVADHWLYLAAAPLLAGVVALGVIATQQRAARVPMIRVAGAAAAIAVVTGLALLSRDHAAAFVDRETLWTHTLERAPSSYLANVNLGVLRLEAGRLPEAIAHFERATRAEPGFAEAWVNLGNALDASGRMADAVPHWERAIVLDPKQSIALYNLSVARIKAGKLDEAESFARRAFDLEPRDSRPLAALRYVYEQQGRPAAIDAFVARAAAPPSFDRATRGRTVVRAVWAAYAVVLLTGFAVTRVALGAPARSS